MRVAILTSDNREGFKDYANPAPRIGVAPEALLQGFAALGNQVEVHVVSCLQNPAPSPEKIADNIWYHGLHVPRIGWLRSGYLGCIRAVRRKLREIRPDLVHGQGTERDCALCAAFSGFQNIVTIHGNMRAIAKYYQATPGSFHWVTAKLETVAIKRTGSVFCNSAYTEGLVAPIAKRIWRVPNALRQPFFEQPLAAPGNSPVLLNIGEIFPRKRQLELLGIARNLHHRGLHFELKFIGAIPSKKTDYGERFLREVAVAQGAGYATYLGPMPVRDLINALDQASALVHCPSEEAFGLVVAEGLARNLKFFGSAVGGIVDICHGVEGAEVFPSLAALEEGIANWLKSNCPRPQTAKQTVQSRYAPEVVAMRHLEIYRSLV